MPDLKTTPGNEGMKGIEQMSSEEVEVRAIGNATSRSTKPEPNKPTESEQNIEYKEKHELAVDEQENADPAAH